jgi:uncharacterized membrane protein YdjX (TVP38/TMEM64 family)
MTKYRRFIIIGVWVVIIYLLYKNGLILLDTDKIRDFLEYHEEHTIVLFTFLSIIRIFIFIPGVTFMVIGGILFDPVIAFTISMSAMIVSQSTIFVVAKLLTESKLKKYIVNKHPDLGELIEQYDYKLLALGIITPIAPTDVICFLSSSIGLKYTKYILTVVIANIPMMVLYSFIGESANNSILSLVLIALTVIIVTVISINMWNKLKHQAKDLENRNKYD